MQGSCSPVTRHVPSVCDVKLSLAPFGFVSVSSFIYNVHHLWSLKQHWLVFSNNLDRLQTGPVKKMQALIRFHTHPQDQLRCQLTIQQTSERCSGRQLHQRRGHLRTSSNLIDHVPQSSSIRTLDYVIVVCLSWWQVTDCLTVKRLLRWSQLACVYVELCTCQHLWFSLLANLMWCLR